MKNTQNILSFLAILLFIACSVCAQEYEEIKKKLEVNGYFSTMQSIIDIDTLNGRWITDYQITNRLNIFYYPLKSLAFSIQARNRFIYGDQIKYNMTGEQKKSMAADNGLFDLTFNIFDGKSYVFNVSVDRLWMKYTLSKFEITIGRQRINWGQTYVWNPNDIFNAYSYFDFDYEERPGSDAIRLQYYTGATSSAEVAFKIDSCKNVTAAGLFRMNKWGYDVQFLTGILNSEDVLAGLGWSGSIKGAGFKGEISYFHPYRNFGDTSGLFFFAMGVDYAFRNSLYIGFEGLYNPLPGNFSENGFAQFYQEPLTVKKLSFTEYNLFVQISYPIIPILNVTLAGMYFPDISGYFIGPTCTYSLMDNLDFSVYLQFFKGKFEDQTGITSLHTFNMGFLRLKYNF